MKFKYYIIILTAVILSVYSFGYYDSGDGIDKVRNPEITKQEVYEHIKFLASDALEGRFPGTKGDSLTEYYIAGEFKKYKLKPFFEKDYFQPFSLITDIQLTGENKFQITSEGSTISFKLDEDFIPMGYSSSGNVSGEMVFAGYGISAPDQNYSDYSDSQGNPMDVSGKILVMMRYSPGESDPHNNPFEKYESMRMKTIHARDSKAAGIIFITGPESGEESLQKLKYDNVPQDAGLPVINCKREIIENILKKQGMDLQKIQKDIDSLRVPNSFYLNNANAEITTNITEINSKTDNVIGFLEGSDPVLKNEVIVIGAHKDHLGYGTYGSLYKGADKQIHNGADDNASGTAGVLELAQKFSSERKNLKRSILFICFGAEEAGLIGSAYFTKSSLLDKKKIIAMINMDMIGRLSEDKLIIYGTGTSTLWDNLLDSLNGNFKFAITKNPEGLGPSDHSSFYSKNIPVLHFFSGTHKDYHSPTDDVEKINSDGEVKILKYIYNIAEYLDDSKEIPDFKKVKVASNENRSMGNVKVYVGTIPDYSYSGEGMKISGVKEGSPAEKGGMQAEDIIIKFGNTEVKNIYDYMYAMGEFKPGEEAEIVVKRNNENVTLKVVLGSR